MLILYSYLGPDRWCCCRAHALFILDMFLLLLVHLGLLLHCQGPHYAIFQYVRFY